MDLVCTKVQYEFLKELAKATKVVSTYACMPIITLYEDDLEVDKGVSPSQDSFKFVEGEDARGDDISHYELDTTKL